MLEIGICFKKVEGVSLDNFHKNYSIIKDYVLIASIV